MADLVEITFPSEEKAEQVRQKLLDMQNEYLIELADAVIAVKQPNGRVKLNQLVSTTATGAVSGTFWGALIGMIFLMPLAGAAIGAASGALGGALADVGINDRFMKDAAQSLQSGQAALFLLIRKMTTDKVLAALQGEGGPFACGLNRRRFGYYSKRWLGREDSNLRMAESKSAALPLGYAPSCERHE